MDRRTYPVTQPAQDHDQVTQASIQHMWLEGMEDKGPDDQGEVSPLLGLIPVPTKEQARCALEPPRSPEEGFKRNLAFREPFTGSPMQGIIGKRAISSDGAMNACAKGYGSHA